MIKYNWEKIAETTQHDASQIMLVLHMLTYPRRPSNFKDPTYRYFGQTFEGHSFLLNPERLLAERKNYTNTECAEYVAIASYRNYIEYRKTKETTLQLINLPFLEEIFNNNRLLQMKDGIIHFKFEETQITEKNNGNKI
tara:strand:+ start:375 stop:791 length:417 start_codon:yes stop_codon:yes gene_type:complete